MTPDQIARVREVVDLVGQHPEFGATFYSRLFAVAPQTEAMFGDAAAQQQKLVDELGAMVELLGDLGGLEVRAGELGDRHRSYGVRAAHYRTARAVMAEALDEVLGAAFTDERRDAWNRATMLITELMQTT